MQPPQRPDPPTREKPARMNPLRVVAIGGGTGLSTLLKGLKAYVPSPIEPYQPAPGRPTIRSLYLVRADFPKADSWS